VDKDTTYGLSPERLGELLGMTLESEDGHDDVQREETTGRLLRACLGATSRSASALASLPGEVTGGLHECLASLAGKSMGEALVDSCSTLDVLKQIRCWGKGLAAEKPTGAEHAVGIAVYYGAITSALLFHDTKITSLSHEELADSVGRLIDRRWLTPQIAAHMRKAQQICRERILSEHRDI